ncbi:hypothetical protein HDE68_003084 [Pedobacter cryoconitis]|uniref:DUF4249 domain-containing protein n=1 Tax=Pedobacter cryoconitis TaxID=188932 RepID=A0A7W8ZNB2_9SPHI|nr:DUF4249 family protein [Pedobacter cryoconitis]MBB5637171.1 hypothetical protein [Pedobacter cryoconitis]
MHIYSKKNLLALLILLSMSSCEKETNVDISKNPAKLVVLGEFNQEDDALINLSTSVFSTAKGAFPDVEDAQISLLDKNNTLIEKYTYQSKGNYTGKKAMTGQQYKLAVNYNGETYQAQTTIPSAFNLNLIEQDASSLIAEIVDLSLEINAYTFEILAKPFTVDRYYLENGQKIKVNSEAEFTELLKIKPNLEPKRDTTFNTKFSRIYIETADNRTENVKYNVLKDNSGRIFLTDKTFNGGKTTLEIYYQNLLSNTANIQYVLVVKSTDPVYFNYLYSSDLQAAKSLAGITDVPIKGNIVNALGIWGGAYVKKIILKN